MAEIERTIEEFRKYISGKQYKTIYADPSLAISEPHRKGRAGTPPLKPV